MKKIILLFIFIFILNLLFNFYVIKAKELLKKINLLDKIYEYPNKLSGGQQQRIAIIRSIILNPKVMLFDEPTSALDPEMIYEVFDSLKKLQAEGMTLVIVSHEMAFIKELNPRIVYLEDGKIKKIGTYKDCLKDKENESLQLFLSKID